MQENLPDNKAKFKMTDEVGQDTVGVDAPKASPEATPYQPYERSFSIWLMDRSTLKYGPWVISAGYTLFVLLVGIIALLWASWQNVDFSWSLLIWLSLGGGILTLLIQLLVVRRGDRDIRSSRNVKTYREVCIHAAKVAADDLSRGDNLKGSLMAERLLWGLSDLLKVQKIEIMPPYLHESRGRILPRSLGLVERLIYRLIFPIPIGNIAYIRPERIPKRAILRILQASGDTTPFQYQLRDLAAGLEGNEATSYIEAYDFLAWLHQIVEPHRKGTEALSEKYPTLVSIISFVGKISGPALGLAVVELVRRLIVSG